MTPLARYQAQLAAHQLKPNAAQAKAVQYLDDLYHALETAPEATWWQRIKEVLHPYTAPKGVYLWGSVGVGKTYLMDLFFDTLTIPKKRQHFHEFLVWMQHALRTLQGQPNPLTQLAKQVAQETQVLCFDELYVTDIGDAMLLGPFFAALYAEHVVIVATSNIAPDDLYKDGLQREQFLPAIQAIKAHSQVVHLETVHDYRQDHDPTGNRYFYPLGPEADHHLAQCFSYLTQNQAVNDLPLILFERPISVKKRTDSILWLSFEAACGVPRASPDYLVLAERFQVIIISQVPQFAPQDDRRVTTFMNLIDVLYDHRIQLIVSAAVPLQELYPHGRLTPAFARTRSRLTEMQAETYGKSCQL
ncbi:MAG: hypothetical protein A3J38_04870 [Gammaproteobacteria bacterium RIFCSPHIGHO2_12_FULL_45_9]|nr:MAG: hypothetical protein A3J38_04870 [Gammaproteobacteria bacterium RIFCSPHIGHO2_12_FULL_45_9]